MLTPVSWPKSALLLVASIFLTAVSFVLGAAPLKVFREQVGTLPFLLLSGGFAVLFWSLQWVWLAISFMFVSFIVSIWVDLEAKQFNLQSRALITFVVSFSLLSAIAAMMATPRKEALLASATAAIEASIVRIQQMNSPLASSLRTEDLLWQAPSAVAILIILVMVFLVLFEKKSYQVAALPYARKERLTDFKLPDFFVWIVIASVFGAFWKGLPKEVTMISLNILNVCVVGYFFHGMAILCRYFQVFKVTMFWRVLWVALFSLQLFLLLSFIGLSDYWFDYRKQLSKRATGLKKKTLSD